MMTQKTSSPSRSRMAHEADSREPPSDQLLTNLLSPNRQQLLSPPPRISTSSSILSDSESPGSYTSYSSADYSSVGGGVATNHTTLSSSNSLNGGSNNSKKKILLKSSNTYHSSLNSHAADNNEFNFGHGLLSQVHKMQSLLEEYQNSLIALEIEKADNQQEINKLDKRLKGKGETEERYKEEIWNLELTKQELLQKIHELIQDLSRSTSEQTRLEREELVLTQELEHLKAIQQSWEQKLKEAQENHELEIISLKKLLHTNRIEKENLSRQIQDLTTQHAVAMATTTLRHVDNEENVNHEKSTPILTTLAQPLTIAPSTNNSNNRNNSNVEIDALKTSLNQAHEIIHTMQEKIDKERDERIEVDKLLREAQETIENFHNSSQNNSTQWYPPAHQSPTLSVNSNNNNLLSPNSPSSVYSHSSHHRHHRHHSRRSTAAPCSGKSCRKRFSANARSPYPVHGKSLCDELSQAGSITNFTTVLEEMSSPTIKVTMMEVDQHVPSSKVPALNSNSPPVMTINTAPSYQVAGENMNKGIFASQTIDPPSVNRIDKSQLIEEPSPKVPVLNNNSHSQPVMTIHTAPSYQVVEGNINNGIFTSHTIDPPSVDHIDKSQHIEVKDSRGGSAPHTSNVTPLVTNAAEPQQALENEHRGVSAFHISNNEQNSVVNVRDSHPVSDSNERGATASYISNNETYPVTNNSEAQPVADSDRRGVFVPQDNFESPSGTTMKVTQQSEETIISRMSIDNKSMRDETTATSRVSHTARPPVELTYVDLPSISNHDMYSSFSSSNSSSNKSGEEDDNYNEEIKLVVQQKKNDQHFGSLLKNPESYIYRSRRQLNNEKKNKEKSAISDIFAAATTTADNVLEEGKKRDSHDDGSVTALTRTMIGDWMWKYTRKVVGSGISENRHRRFFWIHPYTQTLYWSSKEPGSNGGQSSTKSVLVESFVVLDNGNVREKSMPPSILIKTPSRGLKIQCLDITSHHAWIKSLKFLLADNNDDGNKKQEEVPRMSRLGSVSKHHYLNRKKSRQQQQQKNIENSSTAVIPSLPGTVMTNNIYDLPIPSPSPFFNNSTLVDLSNSQSNFFTKL